MRPSTRLSSSTWTASTSTACSSSVSTRMTLKPLFFAVSVIPLVARPKCGFSMSSTTTPMVLDFPVFMLRASSFGR